MPHAGPRADESKKVKMFLFHDVLYQLKLGCFWTVIRSCFSLNWASELREYSGKIPFWRTFAKATGGYSE